MQVRWDIFLVIAGCAVVTLLPRVLPLAFLSRVKLPDWSLRWLGHIPVAVMAALLAQALFVSDGGMEWKPYNLLAAIPAGVVALKTRSLLLTVVAGVGTMMLLMQL